MASSLHVLYVDGAGTGGSRPTSSRHSTSRTSAASLRRRQSTCTKGRTTTTGPLDVLSAIVSHDHAQVISISWGNCEAQDGGSQVAAVEANLFEEAAPRVKPSWRRPATTDRLTAAHRGGTQAPVAAVDDPGSQPYVTSVGGTSLATLGPPPTETVWNNSAGAGGGGISSNWAMPAYQSDAPPALGVVNVVLLGPSRAARRPATAGRFPTSRPTPTRSPAL